MPIYALLQIRLASFPSLLHHCIQKAVIFNLQPTRQVELYKGHILHWLRSSGVEEEKVGL